MEIETTRFGILTVDADALLTFPRGLIGMTDLARFVLIPPTGVEGDFYWLQSVEDAAVAFLVVDPNRFFKDYHVSIREETQADLDLADAKDGQLYVICNRVGEWVTGNLQGPLVINTRTRVGQQVVLTEKKWTCRQPLLKLESVEEPALARAA
ncbi:MAG: flagellar assembly factor FliW [Phycisphaerales bacterium]|jgi:flagellar assembly factor FliW|nr:flagellar assembly factor FliW [Phycisphaerales bacterium]